VNKDELLKATPLRGSNQVSVRGFNERLVLHLIRQHGTCTKAEATLATGLSANAVSVIFNALQADGLLLRGDPIRGRVGQPSVPMRINPEARHFIGLKIGRRGFDMIVVDFSGAMIARRTQSHSYPTPAGLLDFVRVNLRPLLRTARKRRDQIAAFGVAMPSELWHWSRDFDAPRAEMEAWRDFDVASALRDLVPGEISVENDGTCACRAELVFGPQRKPQDFIYFFVGTFIGGGIVLNGSVFPGQRGNAGGFGPLRIPGAPEGDRLIDHASLFVLGRMLAEQGDDPGRLDDDGTDWRSLDPALTAWIDRAGRGLAHAIVSTQAVIEFDAVVIDGAFPAEVRTRLIQAVARHLDQLDLRGIFRPEIGAGHFGGVARALGGAAFHVAANWMVDQNTLLRKVALERAQ